MKSIVLLSGGLDSSVALAVAKQKTDIERALFFNYRQKAYPQELKAVKKLVKHYNVSLDVIDLSWLGKVSRSGIVSRQMKIPKLREEDLNRSELLRKTAKDVWVPNRNALFLNVAAATAEGLGVSQIIAGFNAEEAATFPDNSLQFVRMINQILRISTMSKPEVISYFQNKNKMEIAELGARLSVPFEYIYSCYAGKEKMCGECESCQRLKRAFKASGNWEKISKRFVK